MIVDKKEVRKNFINGSYVYYLENGGGIHGKLKNWKPGDPEREPAFTHIFKKEILGSSILFDIGANVGYYSFVAAQIMCEGKHGLIYAIEPDPRNVDLLKRGIKRNEYNEFVFPYEMGFSNKKGNIDFHLSKATNLSSTVKTEHSNNVVSIPVDTLNMFAYKNRIVKDNIFIRMDIEGHEVEVLQGAMTFLKKDFPCKIFMEVHPQFYWEAHSLERELQKLIRLGFTTKVVISAAIAQPKLFAEHGYEPNQVFDCGRFERGIYYGMSNEDAISFASHQFREDFDEVMINRSGETFSNKIVRSILLERK